MYTSKASIYKVHIRHLHIVAITVLNELSWIKSTETKKSEFSELGCLFSLCCMSTEIHISDLAIFHLSKYLPSTPLSHIPQVLAHQSPSPLLLRNFAGCECPECWVLLPLRAKSLVLGGASLCLSSCMGWAFLLKPCRCLVLTFILYCPQGLYSAQYPSKTSAPVALCLALTWGKFSLLFASVSSSCFLSLASVCCPHYTSLYLLWCPSVLGCSSLGTDNHSFLLAFFLKVSKAVVKFRGFFPASVCHIQNPHKPITLSIALQDFQL